jgi:hypothetical protein
MTTATTRTGQKQNVMGVDRCYSHNAKQAGEPCPEQSCNDGSADDNNNEVRTARPPSPHVAPIPRKNVVLTSVRHTSTFCFMACFRG